MYENTPQSNGQESVPASQEKIPVTISYKYTYASGTPSREYSASTFELAAPEKNLLNMEPTGFDGYVETPFGSFAFEGDIAEAKVLLGLVKKFVEAQRKAQELATILSQKKSQKNFVGPTRSDGGDFDAYSRISGEIEILVGSEKTVKIELVNLTSKLQKYKI